MKTHILRFTLVWCMVICALLISKAQYVTIPDAAFVTYLQATFPSCMNGNQMDTTCSGITGTTHMYCSHRPIKDLTGIQYFDSLYSIDCTFDSISTINAFPKRLRTLDCSWNQITSIANLPDSLWLLKCELNQLTVLPLLPSALSSLDFAYNSITALPSLPATLVLLRCGGNQLTVLPTLPTQLMELNCSYNQLSSIPALPNTLTNLDCSGNPLSVFPVLPNSLTDLGCFNNNLTTLPTLPNSLKNLSCGGNQIDTLHQLPDSLIHLDCTYGNILSINSLPGSLQYFNCSNNALTTLPALPNSLTDINCSNNPLALLPQLPDSLYSLDCSSTNLTCMPHLNKVVNLSFYYTYIGCLPNYPQANQNSSPALDTILLCDPFNVNACSLSWNIKGKVYNDSIANCIKDVNETNLHNIKLNLFKNGAVVQQSYSADYGVYSFATDTGTYTVSVDTTGLPFVVLCPVSGFDTSVITLVDTLSYDRDFALQCKPGFDVGVWSVVSDGAFQPAHSTYVHINAGDIAQFWAQTCNTAALSGQLVTTITGSCSFVSSAAGALTPVVSGNTLTYNIADWSVINPGTAFNIVVKTDTAATIGSQICFDIDITPATGDNNTTNNHLSHCFAVVSSYDPNMKEVYPLSAIDVDSSKWLSYTVHFQNTGTAPAENIYVADTLDTDIDAGSFQLLAYSHQPVVTIKENIVRFTFLLINLPDSNTNEPLSHGYVQYKVKLKDNLPVGTQIKNTAYIYFDFNSPVVTNTTTNTITTGTGIQTLSHEALAFSIFPNPASESVTIQVNEKLDGSIVTVADITGRVVMAVSLNTQHLTLNTSNFANGVYLVRLTNRGGVSAVRKLLRE